MYDVIIIGSGVSGSAAARELSRYKAKVCVLEKEEDVCCGTSKANSGIVHAGYDAKEGSLMAKLNVRGNAMMEQLSKELDFPFQRVGSLVICLREEDMDKLQALYDRGVANGVPGLQILNREEVLEMEPNIVDNVYAALYAPSAGIVCPFGLNIAMAENACENGVEFKFDTKVQRLEKKDDIWEIHTNQGVFKTKYVVNAAGVYADKFHNMVSEKKIHITPRRGDYCLLDKTAGECGCISCVRGCGIYYRTGIACRRRYGDVKEIKIYEEKGCSDRTWSSDSDRKYRRGVLGRYQRR